ncbi:hypothetical protein [Reichenbachiella sp.]|uniref:hypothetical protein n=1 Tax=Reichenbachiella sp. TaxID=2184521 RepID=UPI003B5905AC
MQRKLNMIVGMIIFLSSCQSPNEDCCGGPKEVALGESFSIKVGETVNISQSSAVITFETLISDSLCPADVECLTLGTLSIAINVSGTEKTLSIGDNAKDVAHYKDYSIVLERLVYPTKQSEKDSNNSTYAVQMKITRS